MLNAGFAYAQNSAERLVRDYENSLYNLEASVDRVTAQQACTGSDWASLNDAIRRVNDAFYRVYDLDDDKLNPYQSRLDACKRKSRQLFEKAIAKARQQNFDGLLGLNG
jgi:hypothetical protein